MIRYEIDLKQRGGKWATQCERDTMEAIQICWDQMTRDTGRRLRENRKRLRCTKIENGIRTVLAKHDPV